MVGVSVKNDDDVTVRATECVIDSHGLAERLRMATIPSAMTLMIFADDDFSVRQEPPPILF